MLLPRGHLPEGSLVVTATKKGWWGRVTGIEWVEVRDAARCDTTYGTAIPSSPTTNSLVPNVNSAEAETEWYADDTEGELGQEL